MDSLIFDEAVYAAAVAGQMSIAEARLRMQLVLTDWHERAMKANRLIDCGIHISKARHYGFYRSPQGLSSFIRPVLPQHRRGRWTMTEFQ